MARWRSITPQARRPNEVHRLKGGGRLNVEADAIPLLDRDHGALAVTPGKRREDREPGTDRDDLRPEPGEPTADDGEDADRPQAQERDPPRALGGQRRGGASRAEHLRHRLARPQRATEHEADDRS